MTPTQQRDDARVPALEAQARVEADGLRRDGGYVPRLQELVDEARGTVHGGDVARHQVAFAPEKWPKPALGVFAGRNLAGPRLSRADVITSGRGEDADWAMFVLSFAWGWGRTGYGPARLAGILKENPGGAIRGHLTEASALLASHGPVAGYDRLLGAVKGWGPAFFTKWMYFADRAAGRDRALILDSRVARQVHRLTGMNHLIDLRGRIPRWTAYRYAVYLAWAHQVAGDLTATDGRPVPADLVELALFR